MRARLKKRSVSHRKRWMLAMWLVVMAGIAFSLPNAAFGAAVDTGSATKFTVNSDTTNYYTYAIAGLAGGKTGVINKEGSVYSYRIYSSSGSLLENVNLSSVMNGRESHVDLLHAYGLANGRSLITWEGKESGSCDSNSNSMYQFSILNADGTVYVPATDISTATSPYNCYTNAAELSDGKIAFIWQHDASTFLTRVFNANGTSVTPPTPIESTGTREGNPNQDSSYTHGFAGGRNGGYLVVYNFNNNANYYAVLYNNDGTQKTVNGYNQFILSDSGGALSMISQVEALSNGNFLVGYANGSGYRLKIIRPDGSTVVTITDTSLFNFGDNYTSFMALNNGGFLAMDSKTTNDSTDYEIREFDNNGSLVTDWRAPDTEPSLGWMGIYLARGYDQGFIAYNNLTGKVNLHQVYQAPQTYTVTYSGNGQTSGTVPTDGNSYPAGTTVTAAANTGSLANTGYTFSGWNTQANGSGTAYAPGGTFAMGGGNVTLYAQWAPNTYTVTFDKNGGDVNASPATKTATYGGNVGSLPTAPTKTGYAFAGWNTAPNGTGTVFDATTAVTGNVTVYAKWTIKTYAVTFKDWNGTELKTETVNHGSDATAPADPTRTGYTFTGWDQAFANVTGALTVTAQYDVNQYAISFDSNGGSAVAAINGDYGTKIAAPAKPTRTGYRFDGWYKEAGLTTAWDFAADTMPENGTTLYAKWTAVFAVVYDGNGSTDGSAPADSLLYEDAASVTVLGNMGSMYRSGYSFTGWNTKADGSGTSYKAGDAFAIDKADVTLYAVWQYNPAPPANHDTGLLILIDGVSVTLGSETTTAVNNQSTATITVDENGIKKILDLKGPGSVITIVTKSTANSIVGQLSGELLQYLAQKQASLEIKTNKGSYILPANRIDIKAILAKLGGADALKDMKVSIEVSDPAADMLDTVKKAALSGNFKLVLPPVNFTVKVTYGDTVIDISKFSAYVERLIPLPAGVDLKQITTGIVIEPNGTVRHVPTKVVLIDGVYYASIQSLTNSTYAVVWHPIAFADVSGHWAKDAVNDMGSRMIVLGDANGLFNPNQAITRAEFAATLVRALGLKPESGSSVFADVGKADWYYDAVNAAYRYKLISGYADGTFRPNDRITREQAMSMLARAMEITGLRMQNGDASQAAQLSAYADADQIAGWAREGVLASLSAELVQGRSDGRLAPKEFVTRAEVASMVERLLGKSELI